MTISTKVWFFLLILVITFSASVAHSHEINDHWDDDFEDDAYSTEPDDYWNDDFEDVTQTPSLAPTPTNKTPTFTSTKITTQDNNYTLIRVEPIYADVADLVEYTHCHENPMTGHYQPSFVSSVGTVAGAALGNEVSEGSFKPFGVLLGAVVGNKIGNSIHPPQKVKKGSYTYCGKSYKNIVVSKIVGNRYYYQTQNNKIKVVERLLRE